MDKLGAFLRLIRVPNLVIIVFTQYAIRYCFLYTYYKQQLFALQIPEPVFLVFSLAFVCMAAGGYVINDYYDVKADNINKPGKVIVGEYISPNATLFIYWVLTIVGVCLGCWSSTKIGLPMLGLLFFFYASGLWFYTTSFKYTYLVGNLLVALFIAFVPFTAGFVELYASVMQGRLLHSNIDFPGLLHVVALVSIFSFLITLAREIVKDIEDTDGDIKVGCRTLPIVSGIETAKWVANMLLAVIIALLSYVVYHLYKATLGMPIVYISLFIIVPVLISMAMIIRAKIPTDFHKISNWLKLIMVTGICYFVFDYFYMTK